MRTNIIRIGNFQGISIPEILLENSPVGNEVELEVKDEMILIRSGFRTREGWGKIPAHG